MNIETYRDHSRYAPPPPGEFVAMPNNRPEKAIFETFWRNFRIPLEVEDLIHHKINGAKQDYEGLFGKYLSNIRSVLQEHNDQSPQDALAIYHLGKNSRRYVLMNTLEAGEPVNFIGLHPIASAYYDVRERVGRLFERYTVINTQFAKPLLEPMECNILRILSAAYPSEVETVDLIHSLFHFQAAGPDLFDADGRLLAQHIKKLRTAINPHTDRIRILKGYGRNGGLKLVLL